MTSPHANPNPNTNPAKYDAYADLDLSRSLSCASLSARIDEMIAGVSPTNDAELDKLRTLRTILGSPTTREVYDRDLDDPAVTELGVRRLRDIAASTTTSPAPTTPSPHPWQPQPQPQPRPQEISIDLSKFAITAERSRSTSRTWAVGWAWIAFIWIILPIVLFRTLAGADSVGMDWTDASLSLILIVLCALCNTIGTLSVLQFVWTLRTILGRRQHRPTT